MIKEITKTEEMSEREREIGETWERAQSERSEMNERQNGKSQTDHGESNGKIRKKTHREPQRGIRVRDSFRLDSIR